MVVVGVVMVEVDSDGGSGGSDGGGGYNDGVVCVPL